MELPDIEVDVPKVKLLSRWESGGCCQLNELFETNWCFDSDRPQPTLQCFCPSCLLRKRTWAGWSHWVNPLRWILPRRGQRWWRARSPLWSSVAQRKSCKAFTKRLLEQTVFLFRYGNPSQSTSNQYFGLPNDGFNSKWCIFRTRGSLEKRWSPLRRRWIWCYAGFLRMRI